MSVEPVKVLTDIYTFMFLWTFVTQGIISNIDDKGK